MLYRTVCVSFRPNVASPKKPEIKSIFEIYGRVRTVISDNYFSCNFFVLFESRREAEHCYKQRKLLYKLYEFVVELKDNADETERDGIQEVENGIIPSEGISEGDDKGEIISSEQISGKADPNSPSLLDLNDDCLLHLMEFFGVKEELKYVNSRLRGLYTSLWKKHMRRVSFGEGFHSIGEVLDRGEFQTLEQFYHAGECAAHLSIKIQDSISSYEQYDLLLSSCANLQTLRVCVENGYHDINLQRLLKNISSSVTEIELCNVQVNDLSKLLTNNGLKKLSVKKHEGMLGSRQTVVVNLRDSTQFRVLASTSTLDEMPGPIPTVNNLQELSDMMIELFEKRECCEQQELDANLFQCGIRNFLPSNELQLGYLEIFEGDLNQLLLLSDELQIFIFDGSPNMSSCP